MTVTELLRELARDNPGFLDDLQDMRDLHELLDALVQCRQDAGLTQTDVARRMGITQPTVSAFEAEDSNPRIETAQRYARAVGVRLRLDVDRPLTYRLLSQQRWDAKTWRKPTSSTPRLHTKWAGPDRALA